MEEGNDFPGPEYSCPEDMNGSFMVPLSYTYTPFYIQIPNNYSNVRHASSVDHQHSSEDERACPSGWDHELNTYSLSCPLCCDPSSSLMFHCPPVCSSDGLLPHAGSYQFPSHTTASHTWTPGSAVQYHTSPAEVCDAVASITYEDKQISTHESNRQHNQMDLGHSQVQPSFCPVPPDIEIVGQNKDSIRSFSEKYKKPCHCTKSQCLKLYCECFANGEICSNCSCFNCFNNMEHVTERYKAIKICLKKNPDAFRSKINSSIQGDVKGSHTRGCNCKSSGCLKNYCECYKANIMCSSMCKCVSCNNYSGSEKVEKKSTVEMSSHPNHNTTHCRTNVSCITDAVVEATCGCLLAQAEVVEKEALSPVQAERAILEEFGCCLTQITHTQTNYREHMPRMQALWTCSVLIVILFTESHCVQKTTLTKNWGPQSMLYLKGKYGRRYIPDSDVDFYKSALKNLYAVIRDFEKMKSVQTGRSTRLFTAENLLIRYTE
ncbi:hypothetical protein QTP70_020575 [Hemibagrus guttatus]|uniref:CRC domain-containing protein n=1 Tax=Hemibagrus guttatus TaxID=175788 RepID=A0AAE0QXL0_9TELE|nr:hypothetical protein QTP70_020575 [Hemibagrus guttatus]